MVRKNKTYLFTIILILLMNACAPTVAATPVVEENVETTDLRGIKTYLLDKSSELMTSSKSLKEASDKYYALAESAGFDYAAGRTGLAFSFLYARRIWTWCCQWTRDKGY